MNEKSNDLRAVSYTERSGSQPLAHEKNAAKPHSFRADQRASMVIQGVTDVLRFDEDCVYLVTTCGQLSIEGERLHVTVLNTRDGIVEISGKLCGLIYDDLQDAPSNAADKHKGRHGFFRKLLS